MTPVDRMLCNSGKPRLGVTLYKVVRLELAIFCFLSRDPKLRTTHFLSRVVFFLSNRDHLIVGRGRTLLTVDEGPPAAVVAVARAHVVLFVQDDLAVRFRRVILHLAAAVQRQLKAESR